MTPKPTKEGAMHKGRPYYVPAAALRRAAIEADHAEHFEREQAFRAWQEAHAIQDAAVPLFVAACGMPRETWP